MIRGRVIHGDKLGRIYGYPTANIACSPDEVSLYSGVYAGWAEYKHDRYRAALVIQQNPWKVEAHLIGYQKDDFYGEYITIDPVQKVSELERYDSEEELVKKISQDIEMVHTILDEIKTTV